MCRVAARQLVAMNWVLALPSNGKTKNRVSHIVLLLNSIFFSYLYTAKFNLLRIQAELHNRRRVFVVFRVQYIRTVIRACKQ